MKHRRLDKYVTLYTVCREGGKVIYSYVETLPQHRLQDRSLKEFYRQVEEHQRLRAGGKGSERRIEERCDERRDEFVQPLQARGNLYLRTLDLF